MSNNERLLQKVSGIEEFIRVAETLSFVRAAESLGQAPSAVSKSVRQLELRLGARLFHRTTRTVTLTEEGSRLYERANRWVGELDDIHTMIGGDAAELSGLIRIDMPTTFGRSLFMPHLAAFLDRHPKLAVEVRMNDHHVNLVAEGVDLAVRLGDLADSEMVVRPLGRVRMGTYVCPSCLERYGRPESPPELLSHRLVSFLLPSGRQKPMLYTGEAGEIVINVDRSVASFTNGDAMIDAAIASIGIVQTPAFYAKDGLERGLLTQLMPGLDAPGPAIQLVYPSKAHVPNRVRAMMDYLVEGIEYGLGAAYRY